nr:PREDICTED: uncharacterized protein LOC109037137 [Bemisia tabaci]XP_018907193.1 PREDICTED: uncharacterized protein LOC109037137 [Bemisia tabaci]
MEVAVSVALLILANLWLMVIPQTKKDDKHPRPANASYSGCRLTIGKLTGANSESNDGIQMGECWANTRVHNQKCAFFVPFEPGHEHYDSEGGPYGSCLALDQYPQASDMSETTNLANWCFFWETKVDPSSNASAAPLPSAPGEKGLPMPIVCPSNLKDCYSADWFEPGGKLGAYGDLYPTYGGIWFPLKDPSTRKPLFCQGLGLGCDTPNMRGLQLQHLINGTCDVEHKCHPPNGTNPKP